MSKAAEERRKEKEAATLAQLAAQEKRAEEVRPAFLSLHDQEDQDDLDDRMIRRIRVMKLLCA